MASSILVGSHPVDIASDFTYLSSVVDNVRGIEKEPEAHTAQAKSVMGESRQKCLSQTEHLDRYEDI